jgi:hypothetical protein
VLCCPAAALRRRRSCARLYLSLSGCDKLKISGESENRTSAAQPDGAMMTFGLPAGALSTASRTGESAVIVVNAR